MGEYTILQGKVEEILPSLFAEGDFDACLCDPPYLLEFMGKEFDKQHKKMPGANDGQRMQAWHERWTREVLRVLKPGAHMLAFGGTRTYHRLASAVEDVGFEVRDMMAWMHGQGFPKGKSQLKPAHEPVVLGRKPGENGHLSLDACRISTAEKLQGSTVRNDIRGGRFGAGHRPNPGDIADYQQHEGGRWPANLILSHHPDCIGGGECHPDCPVRMLDEQSGIVKPDPAGARSVRKIKSAAGNGRNNALGKESRKAGEIVGIDRGDGGGASRFFYCAKVSPRERNLGGTACRHPTLKPLSLCAYLATLLLPPPSPSPRRILIPFSGAGSEVIGALRAGWDEVYGIEQDEEYNMWAESRIPAALELEGGNT